MKEDIEQIVDDATWEGKTNGGEMKMMLISLFEKELKKQLDGIISRVKTLKKGIVEAGKIDYELGKDIGYHRACCDIITTLESLKD